MQSDGYSKYEGRPDDKNIIRQEIETKMIEHLKIFHTTFYIN